MERAEAGDLSPGQMNLLQVWFSPSFPVGSFAYSHGLEAAVTKEKVTDAGQLGDWVNAVMLHGSGRTDGALFREAYVAVCEGDWVQLEKTAELGAALLPTEELALESRSQGEAFVRAVCKVWPNERITAVNLERPALPVAAAAACASHGVPLGHSLASWYQSLASALVSAGVRLIPLGQTEGLRVLASLSDSVRLACDQALAISLDDIGSSAPLMEIDSIHHETQYTRLFRS